MATASKSNAVQIVINATDKASNEIKKTTSLLDGVGKAAQSTIEPLKGLGSALKTGFDAGQASASALIGGILNLGGAIGSTAVSFFGAFNVIAEGFRNVQQAVTFLQENEAAKIFFEDLAQQAESAIGSLEYDIVGAGEAVGLLGASFFKGVIPGLGKAKEGMTEFAKTATVAAIAVESVEQETEKVVGVFARLRSMTDSSLGAISQSAQSVASRLNDAFGGRPEAALNRLKTVGATTFEAISQPILGVKAQLEKTFEGGPLASLARLQTFAGTTFEAVSNKLQDVKFQINDAFGGKPLEALTRLTFSAELAFGTISLYARVAGGIVNEMFDGRPLAALKQFQGGALLAFNTIARPIQGIATRLSEVFAGGPIEKLKSTAISAFEGIKERLAGLRQSIEQGGGFGATLLSFFDRLSQAAGKAFEQIKEKFAGFKLKLPTRAGLTPAAPLALPAGASESAATEPSSTESGSAESSVKALEKVGQAGEAAAKKVAGTFVQASFTAKTAVNGIGDSLSKTAQKIEGIPKKISGALDIGSQIADTLGASSPLKLLNQIKGGIGELAGPIFNAVQELGSFGLGLGTLQQLVASGPFKILIGQNVELQQQLLSTRASLVSTNQVSQDGRAIKDPTTAIKALDGPVNAAIDQLRATSLDLVGVTSKDLVPVFQLVAGYSSQIGINLSQASDLTASFAASLGTLNVPLYQSRQEIGSILSGSIDMNSVLAKNLGITNQQVAMWKSQGRIFQELTTRLEAFRAGNKLASETIDGYGSNIQEIFDIIGQKAGAQLLEPITKQMALIYKYLKDNQEAMTTFASDALGQLLEGAEAVATAVGKVFNSTAPIGATLIEKIVNIVSKAMLGLAGAIEAVMPVVQPLISILGEVIKMAGSVAAPIVQMALTMKVAQFAVAGLSGGFGMFASQLPIIGPILGLLTGQGNMAIRAFGGLNAMFGTGAAKAVLLGTSITSIPGAAGALGKAITKLNPILGIYSSQIVAAVPQASKAVIGLVGLSKQYPVLGNAIAGVLPLINKNSEELGKAAAKYAPLVDKYLPGMGAKLVEAAGAVTNYSEKGVLANAVTEKFDGAIQNVGKSLRNFVVRWALIGAAVFVAYQAIDKYILQNKELMEVLGGVFDGLSSLITALPRIAESIWQFLISPIGLATAAVSAFALAVRFQAIPALYEFIMTSKIGLMFAAMGVNVLKAGRAIQALGFMTQAGSKALMALEAGIAAGNVTFGAFATALAGVLTPLIAIGGALFVGGLIAYTFVMRDAAAAAEVFGQQTQFMNDRNMALANSLKKAQTAQEAKVKAGIRLSDEEYELNKKLSTQTKLNIADNDAKIAKAKEMQAQGRSSTKGFYDAQIANLENDNKMLKAQTENIQISAKELPRLGTAYEQFGNEVNTAMEAVRNPSGDSEKYKEQASKLLEGTQQMLKGNLITADDAIARFELMSTNVGLDKETQLKAQQAITEARKLQGDRQVEDIVVQEEKIKTLKETGRLGEASGDRQITALKKKELDTQLENLKQAKADADKIAADDLNKQLAEADKKIVAAQLALAAAQGDPASAKRFIEQQQKDLQDGKAKTLAEITSVETEINNIKEGAKGKIGKDADEATNKAIDLQNKINILKRSLNSVDEKLSALDKQSKNPAQEGRVDEAAAKAAQETLKTVQNNKFLIQKKGETLAKESKRGFDNDTSKNSDERAKIEAQELKDAYDQKLRFQDENQKDLDSSFASKKLTEEAYSKASLAITNERLDVELAENQRQRKLLKADDKEGLNKLEAQESEISKRRIEAGEQFYQKRLELRLRYQDENQKILDSKLADNKVTEEDYNQESLQNTKNRLDEELKETERQRKLLQPSDKEGLHKIEAQEADINKRRLEADETFYQKRSELKLRHQDDLQKVLEGNLSLGLVSEEAYAEQSLAITLDRLNVELEEVERQKKRLLATDKEGLLKLAGQEGEIQKKRTEAFEKIVQQRTAILERAEKKAIDIAQLAEVERDTQLQELRNKNLIQDEEANEAQAKSQGEKLAIELEAEKVFADELAKLPKFSDPIKEAERQSQIRSARLKTAETTKSILENEAKQQETHVKLLQALVDRALKDKLNKLEAEKQQVQKVLDLQATLTDALEHQNKVLESRKSLEKAIGDYVSGQFALAASLTENAAEKEKIEIRAAEVRLTFLDRQQLLERESLENDIRKNKLMLEREKIQLRMDKLGLMTERADKEAELEKVLADPKATSRQKRAAQLGVDAVSAKEDVLGYKGVVLEEEGTRQNDEASDRRRELRMKQETDRDQARADYFTKKGDKVALERLGYEVRQDAESGVAGLRGEIEDPNDYRAYGNEMVANERNQPSNTGGRNSQSFEDYLKAKGRSVPNLDTPIVAPQDPNGDPQFANSRALQAERGAIEQRMQVMTNQVPPAPNLTRPGAQASATPESPQLLNALTRLTDFLTNGGREGNIVNLQNSITNHITGADATNGRTASTVGQQILNTLYDVGRLAKARQATN